MHPQITHFETQEQACVATYKDKVRYLAEVRILVPPSNH